MNTASIMPNEKWIEKCARWGLASKGVTYILIGIVSAISAINGSKKGLDKQGAAKEIWEQPYGHVLLILLVLGLVGYVVWRFVQAIKDTENKGTDTKGILKRSLYFVSGLIYSGFAIYCIKLLIGSPGNNSKKSFFAERLMDNTGGQLLLGLVALLVIGYGIYQCYQGYSNKFKEEVQDSQVNSSIRQTYNLLGKLGFISRGIVLILMGFFLGKATLHSNAREAEGSEGALGFLYQMGGSLLMATIAIGLAGYGLFMLVKARYQSIKTH